MNEVDLTVRGSTLTFAWAAQGVQVLVSKFKESSRGAQAEVTVKVGQPGVAQILTHGDLNLKSVGTRASWAKILSPRAPDINWPAILETVCLRALRHYREGDPFIELSRNDCSVIPFHLNPLVFDGYPTILFGSGGIGKSKLGMLCAMLCDGYELYAGLGPSVQGRALYLDWETHERVGQWQAACLRAGTGANGTPLYRHCARPFVDELPLLETYIADNGVNFLVIDSLAPACGRDLNEPGTAIALVNALHSLRISSLVLAHTAKGEQPDGAHTIYGSVFFGNLARSIWEMRGVQEPGSSVLDVGLWHRKCNLAGLHAPLGYRFTLSDSSTAISERAYDDPGQLVSKLPLIDQVKHALKEQGSASARTISEHTLIEDVSKVSAYLSRGVGKWCELSHKTGGQQVYKWSLPTGDVGNSVGE